MRFDDFNDDEIYILDRAIAKWLWQVNHNGIGGPDRDYNSYREEVANLYSELKRTRSKR